MSVQGPARLWGRQDDGYTCFYLDEQCPKCGEEMASDGRRDWCVKCPYEWHAQEPDEYEELQ